MRTCTSCGNQIPDGNAAFCPQCGSKLFPEETPSSAASHPSQAPPATPTTSGLAIVSLICGILFFIFPSALAAIIFGHISQSDIRRSGGRKTGAGMALAGLILGYIGVAIIPIILILAAIAIPNLIRAKMAANEASAVAYLKWLNFTLVQYSNTNGEFPDSLADISTASGIASRAQHGYTFEYHTVLNELDATKSLGYSITASPMTLGSTGRRFFFTDQTGVIRAEPDRTATGSSPPID